MKEILSKLGGMLFYFANEIIRFFGTRLCKAQKLEMHECQIKTCDDQD